jgi:antitoxin VapB
MSLNLKNPGTIALVRELADRTGTSQTAAIAGAVRHRLDALTSADEDAAGERFERAQAILEEAWATKDLQAERARIQGNVAALYDDQTGLPG